MKICPSILLLTMMVQLVCVMPALAASPAPSAAAQNSPSIELIFIKGGCLKMGSEDGDSDEKPVHDVCVSDFSLGKYEITQGQYTTIMGKNPSIFAKCGPDCPVDNVSWDNAQEFIKKLNAKSGKNYRLPTEAEWEYAARSGGNNETWAGINTEVDLEDYAWYSKNSDQITHQVGQKRANGLGLFDMTGNVSEWCQDWYGENYYTGSPKDNPQGSASGQNRVVRGGAFGDDAQTSRNAKRDSSSPAHGNDNNGFRLVLPAK